jgi:hypothetical protein
MPKKERLYERHSYALHRDHRDYLLRVAFKRRCSMSELLRDILDAYIEINPTGRKRK